MRLSRHRARDPALFPAKQCLALRGMTKKTQETLIDISLDSDILRLESLQMAKKTTKTQTAATSKPAGSPEAFAEAAECLKTLAHPVRLRIVQLLLHGRYTVGEIAEDCGIPDNVASEHLRLMQRCGFFTSARDGRRVYYQIAEAHLANLMNCIESRFLDSAKP